MGEAEDALSRASFRLRVAPSFLELFLADKRPDGDDYFTL
jgi:hypothetical protein